MKLNRRLLMVLALVMSLAMATTGTLAYLTDTDAIENTFTFGNVDIELEEDFEQGSELLPGVDVEKIPTIKNTGDNDAWVWLTWSIPAAMDNWNPGNGQDGSNNNIIHWNPMGATHEGYVTAERVQKAFEQGLLTADMFPAGETNYVDYIASNNTTWNWLNNKLEQQVEIDGIQYNTYVGLYNAALKPGETTLPGVYKVGLDAHVDITPEGDMYWVDKGVEKDLNWNIKENGTPKIIVNAFAIQKDEFDTVEDAFEAYMGQWSPDGTLTEDMLDAGLIEDEEAKNWVMVNNEQELLDAVADGASFKLAKDITITQRITIVDGQDITMHMNGKTLHDTSDGMTMWVQKGAKMTITGNGTVLKTNHNQNMIYFDSELNIKNGTFKYEPYTWGECDTSVAPCNHHGTNALKVGSILVGRKGTDYSGVLSIYDGTFDCGILNPEDFLSTNGEIKDKTQPVTMYPTINSHASQPMEATVYGGTFIGANPANGDPNKPYTLYLVGQNEAGVIPEGYTVTESTTADGRTAYTFKYNQ